MVNYLQNCDVILRYLLSLILSFGQYSTNVSKDFDYVASFILQKN